MVNSASPNPSISPGPLNYQLEYDFILTAISPVGYINSDSRLQKLTSSYPRYLRSKNKTPYREVSFIHTKTAHNVRVIHMLLSLTSKCESTFLLA